MPTTLTAVRPADPAARRPWSPRAQAAIDAVIAPVCILPLLLTAHLPLTDLPNHLARQYILRDWASSPTLQAYYAIHWALIPNLALELFVLPARQVMSIDLAIRAFCIVTVLLLFLGTRMINRTFSAGTSRAYRVTPLLVYGGPFQYGFLGYCFGVGLALALFGAWLRLRTHAASTRAAFLLPAGFGLMLCHLAAFGIFAVAVGMCELTGDIATAAAFRPRPRAMLQRLVVPLCCFVPVFLLFVLLSPTASTATEHAVQFSSLHEKLRSFLSITFFTRPRLESALLLLALAGLAAAMIARAIRVHATGLSIVGALLVIWLLTPNIVLGITFVDYRFPWAIAFFLLAALMPDARYYRFVRPIAGYFGVLAAARIALIAALWLTWEPTLAAIDHALSRLPEGARVMVVEGRSSPTAAFRDPDLANVASYVVARRQAFEPSMFAGIAGQVLAFQPHYQKLWDDECFAVGIPISLTTLAPDYDHVLVLLPQFAKIAPGLPLTCQASGPDFEILKVVPDGSASTPAKCP